MKDKKYEIDEDTFRLLKEAIEALPIGITITDPKGKIVYTNNAEGEIHGYRHEELIGKDARMLAPRDLWKPVSFEQLHEMGAWRRESINVKKTGETFPVHLMSIAVKDDKGIPIGIVTGCEDITERKRAEEALLESKERFKLIAETITEAFWIADVSIEKMFYVSPGYERIWRRTCKSLYENPRSFIDAVHPEDRELFTSLVLEKTGEPFEHEYRIIWPDGSIRWIWDRGFPVCDNNGQVTRYVGVAQDITERKQAEKEIQKRVKELEEFYDIAIGRELRMIELKKEMERLKEELEKYKKQ